MTADPDIMSDTLERLAISVLKDAANTAEKIKEIAVMAGWSAEEAISKAAELLRACAQTRENNIQ